MRSANTTADSVTDSFYLHTNTALWHKPTMAAASPRTRLETALDNMADAGELFAGRFMITRERFAGGQAMVQFARGGSDGFFQYAIKCASPRCSTADATLPIMETTQGQRCFGGSLSL